jgi:enolase
MAKYNQLLRIEEELGDSALFGATTFKFRVA